MYIQMSKQSAVFTLTVKAHSAERAAEPSPGFRHLFMVRSGQDTLSVPQFLSFLNKTWMRTPDPPNLW